jgi:hypothetical protein
VRTRSICVAPHLLDPQATVFDCAEEEQAT